MAVSDPLVTLSVVVFSVVNELDSRLKTEDQYKKLDSGGYAAPF